MEVSDKEEYLLISMNDNNFDDFINKFKDLYINKVKKNIILKLERCNFINDENIFVLLPYAKEHQRNKMSFIVVCPEVDADNFPEDFNIVPSLQEAEDVIEMENIQRDLGF